MSEIETNSKFLKFYEEVINMLDWAIDQEHISDETGILLAREINEIKEKIENE